MLVEYNGKSPAAQGSCRRRETAGEKRFSDSEIPFEGRRKAGLDQHADPQIGPPGVQGGNGGSFKDNVA